MRKWKMALMSVALALLATGAVFSCNLTGGSHCKFLCF